MTNGGLMVGFQAPSATIGYYAERATPVIVASVVTFIWYLLGRPFPSPADNLLASSATISSVFAGFLGASAAIILTIKDTRLAKTMVQHGYMQTLIKYLQDGLFAAIGLATLSVCGFLLPPLYVSGLLPSLGVFRSLFVFLLSYSLISFVRFSIVLFAMLRQSLS